MLAYDNGVEYQEMHGAYRFYYTQRDGDVMTRVPYHAKDDVGSSTEFSSDESAIKRANCKFCLFVFLLLALVGVIVTSIIVSVLLTQNKSEPTIRKLQSSVRVTDKNFTEALRNKDSPEFKAAEADFCKELKALLTSEDSPLKEEDIVCNVLEIRNGSLIMIYQISFTSKGFNQDVELRNKLALFLIEKMKDGKLGTLNVDSSRKCGIEIGTSSDVKSDSSYCPTAPTTGPTTATTTPSVKLSSAPVETSSSATTSSALVELSTSSSKASVVELKSTSVAPPTSTSAVRVQSSVRITDRNFTEALRNRSSPEFKAAEEEICNEMKMWLKSNESPVKDEEILCNVLEIRNGSRIIFYQLDINSVHKETLTAFLKEKMKDGKLGKLKIDKKRICDVVIATSNEVINDPGYCTSEPALSTTARPKTPRLAVSSVPAEKPRANTTSSSIKLSTSSLGASVVGVTATSVFPPATPSADCTHVYSFPKDHHNTYWKSNFTKVFHVRNCIPTSFALNRSFEGMTSNFNVTADM